MKGLNFKHGFIFSALSVLVVGLLFNINTASAAVKMVCSDVGPGCDYTNIQAGVDSASSGDTVRLQGAGLKIFFARFQLLFPVSSGINLGA